jgi:hypothetical protein
MSTCDKVEMSLKKYDKIMFTINQKIPTYQKLGFFYILGSMISQENKLNNQGKVTIFCFLKVEIYYLILAKYSDHFELLKHQLTLFF